ncbi:MAG TPA: AAA family ATPase [Chthonomonadaceae bacterium]|nr:AAA family ATPase [Chthonomonadaceae bacterium]
MSDTSFSSTLDTLKEHLVGYDEGVEQFKLALLTGQHMLLVGRPGRGKSYPARMFLGAVRNARIFRTQITAYTMPDHLVGAPIPHTYLEEGRQVYNTDNGILNCDLACLEEFSDGPVALARSLNTILYERLFEVKDQPSLPATLHSALLTANQAPHGEEWKAVWSRIAFRFTPPEVTSPWGRFQTGNVYLHTHGHAPQLPLVDMEQVRELSQQRERLEIPPGVLLVESWISGEFHRRCQEDIHLGRSGLFSSDLRRENLFLDVICAGAVLEGRPRADYSHVRRYLPYALPLGDDADGIAAHAILDEVLEKVLPRKIDRNDLALYDALGDLAQQILAYQHHHGHGPGEFRLRLPGAPTIFAARRELLGHLGRVRGIAGATYLVEVLRQAVTRLGGEEE